MGTGLLTFYSEVKSEPVRWLWYPYIAIGKITLLQGDPGDGKSTMMMQLIAELSRGGATPDGEPFGRPYRVIYQCSEDGACDTIKPRLEAAGADCHNVAFINEEVYGALTLDDERIRDAITTFHPKLVVIDPIQSYIGNDSDLQIAAKARKLMRKIGMLASTYNCAFVLVGHLTKREGTKDLYRNLGSIDVIASARSVLQVERDTQDETIRIVKQIKNSLAPKGNDLRFEINPDTGFHWLRASNYTTPSMPLRTQTVEDQGLRTKHEQGALLLKKALADGPVKAVEIKKLMEKHYIGEKTMNDIKNELGIKSFRKMKAWYWILPTGETNEEMKENTEE